MNFDKFEINWKIRQIKMQRKIVFYIISRVCVMLGLGSD